MSENMNDDLNKFAEIEALISVTEKSANDYEEGSVSVFLTDIRFKESVETGDLLDDAAFSALDAEDQENYEMVHVKNADTDETMGWMFRFKADEDGVPDTVTPLDEPSADDEDVEDEDDATDVKAKADAIIAQMTDAQKEEEPSVFLTDIRFKEMEDDEDLISVDKFNALDDDAKESYSAVKVYEEGTDREFGRRFRRRSPQEVNAMRRGAAGAIDKPETEGEVEEKAYAVEDMFDSEEDALKRAEELGCEGTHSAGKKFMPCATHAAWSKATTAPKEKSEDFLCGFQRKSVHAPCDFCNGGCAPEEGLPGLADVEDMVKAAHSGDVVSSGYSSADDMFVVDVKREDGSCIEVFVSGDGDELGWLRINEGALEGKSAAQVNIVSKADAEAVAMSSFTEMNEAEKGEVMSVMVDVFGNEDVYVVEIDSEEKSTDFFVSIEGKVLGYDEYDLIDDIGYDMSEEDEIKALEAELEIKRMYSREQRESMAESGEAMEDGSFPIADKSDLENAIQAVGRAENKKGAKAHILKRAKELGAEDMIPEGWVIDPANADMDEAPTEEKSDADDSMIEALNEFRLLMEDGIS